MRKETIRDLFGLYPVKKEKQIGIEIEMEGRHLNLPPSSIPLWEKENDGSLRGESIEYKLKQPLPLSKIDHAFKQLTKSAKDNEAKFNPSLRCGIHVHINCQDLTENQVQTLEKLTIPLYRFRIPTPLVEARDVYIYWDEVTPEYLMVHRLNS